MIKNLILWSLMILFYVRSSGQNSYSHDTSLVNIYSKIATKYVQSAGAKDSADYYLLKIKSLSAAIGYNKGMSEYYRLKAIFDFVQGKNDSAEISFNQAFLYALRSGDIKQLGLVHDARAWMFQNIEETDSAIHYYIKALSIADSIHDMKFSGEIANNLSILLWQTGDFKKAEEYAQIAYHAGMALRDSLLISNGLFNFANAKSSLKDLDTALIVFHSITKMIKNPARYYYVSLRAKANEAGILTDLGKYKKSISLYKEVISQSQGASPYLISYFYYGLGYAEYKSVDLKDAENDIQKAIEMATSSYAKQCLRDSYLIMAEIKKSQRLYPEALEFREKYDVLNDTLMNEAKNKYIHLLEIKYNSAKKDKSIAEQNLAITRSRQIIQKKNNMNIILLIGLGLSLVIGLLIFRNFRNRHHILTQNELLQAQRIRELEKEHQLVAMQSVLKGQEEERSRLAKDLHDGVGGLLSGVKLSLSTMKGNVFLSEQNAQSVNVVIEQLDQSIAELRRVSHNMMPEALIKFGLKEALENYCENINLSGSLKVKLQTYGLENRMEQSTEIVLYRMVQELLNNVIKHADAKNVLVQLTREEERFSLTVEDDGKGFDGSKADGKEGAGIANIKARAEYLNGTVDIQSAPGEGTSVNIVGRIV